MEINNKVILITGASSGIGRAVALALSHYNNKIIITARRKQLLEETAKLIKQNGSECLAITGDATDEKHALSTVQLAVKTFKSIDIAILNIGQGPPSNTLTASPEKIKYCMRVNYDTMINFYYPILYQMKKQKTKALIAHMNSLATYFGIPMQGDYTAAKAATRIFLDTVRMELKHFQINNIIVQTIHPGFVDTEASKDDGVPENNVISEEKAAQYILDGIRKEKRENLFPLSMKIATKFGKIVPNFLLTKILLSSVPKEY